MMQTVRRSLWFLCLSFAVLALAARSEAQLGCFADSGSPTATCSIAEDCAPVGGIDCTGGACLCDEGPLSPFCACAASPPTAAPTVSLVGLFSLVGLLIGAGILGLWRRTGPSARLPA
jgi:hypothetical protein